MENKTNEQIKVMLGNKLREIRRNKNIPVKSVKGLSPSLICKIEKAYVEIDIEYYKIYADALEVNFEFIFSEVEKQYYSLLTYYQKIKNDVFWNLTKAETAEQHYILAVMRNDLATAERLNEFLDPQFYSNDLEHDIILITELNYFFLVAKYEKIIQRKNNFKTDCFESELKFLLFKIDAVAKKFQENFFTYYDELEYLLQTDFRLHNELLLIKLDLKDMLRTNDQYGNLLFNNDDTNTYNKRHILYKYITAKEKN